jgi:asparagine synthetase B (glutamine-hydrolysing)
MIWSHLKNKVEIFYYGHDQFARTEKGWEDPGTLGLMYLLLACKDIDPNIKILASGQGGDEIMSTSKGYCYNNPNPNPFPKNLEDCFPWENFYEGVNQSYIYRDEVITGHANGFEGRYPHLDKQVVQEFLWLTPERKNQSWKAPLENFMKIHNYPYKIGNQYDIKRGFNV